MSIIFIQMFSSQVVFSETMSSIVKKIQQYFARAPTPSSQLEEENSEPQAPISYKSYETTLEDLPEFLAQHGVAVLPAVLNSEEAKTMQAEMWAMLAKLTKDFHDPIEETDPRTWASMAELRPLHGLLLNSLGICHSAPSWRARQHPGVAAAFARIWGCEPTDLVTSFDGMSIHLPAEAQPPEVVKQHLAFHKRDWFHVDQSLGRPQFECVQGFVTAFDTNDGDCTLAVFEGSNAFAEALSQNFTGLDVPHDYVPMETVHLDFLRKAGCKRFNVRAPAGSLVLWDSRTVHCGCLPQRGRPTPVPRCVAYVCMWPRARLTQEEIERKRLNALERVIDPNPL